MHETKRPSRRTFLINPRFQLTFIAYTAVVAVVLTAVLYSANALFFWRVSELGRSVGIPETHVFFQFVREQQKVMNVVFGGTVLVALAVLSFFGLFASHRIAGPLHRLRQHMDRVAAGETLDDVKFREKDFFPELADSYNRQLSALRSGTRKAS